jgi:phosphoglycolate phosphatase (TIGR01487 family)
LSPLEISEVNTLWKAIACDFDGTLTDKEGRLSLEALTVVRESETSGIPVIISSGRDLAQLRFLSKIIGTSGPIVAENGGVVWDPKTLRKSLQGDRVKVLRAYRALLPHLDEMELVKPRLRETDIVVGGRRTVELNAILNTDELGVHILDANIATHITDASVDKGIGLETAAKILNINPKEIVAIGDSQNDIAMFQAAGKCFAVGNAHPLLKAQANSVTKQSFGKGCADAIRAILRETSLDKQPTS